MADTVKNIFNPPKPKGPDPELIAAQRRQQERLDSRDAEEERKRKAREKVLAARSHASTSRATHALRSRCTEVVLPVRGLLQVG